MSSARCHRPGYGYRVVAEQGNNDHEEVLAQYQGTHGRIDADYRRDGWTGSDPGHATLTGMGGIVLIGRDIFFTRPLTDSYALIRVPGVAGVHGTISNQVVERPARTAICWSPTCFRTTATASGSTTRTFRWITTSGLPR